MSQSNQVNKYPGQIVLGGKFTIDANGMGSSAALAMNSLSTIGLGTDTVTGAINIGTGALARTVTIGNTTGASAVVLSCGSGGIAVPRTTVTQGTSVTTTVVASSTSGVITTFSQSAAADVAVVFTVTNTVVTANDRILVSIVDYAGTYATNGNPVVSVNAIGSGTFDIVVVNTHSVNALSGALQISFVVLK